MNLPKIDWDPSKPPRRLLLDELDVVIEHLKKAVTPDLKEVPSYLVVLAVTLGGGVVERHCILMPIDENRHKMVRDIGMQFAKKYLPIVGVFVMSAWMADLTDDQAHGRAPVPRASKAPDRREVVIVAGATFDRKVAGVLLPVYRTEDNCVRVGWGESKVSEEIDPHLLVRFFEGAAITLADYKMNKPPTNEDDNK